VPPTASVWQLYSPALGKTATGAEFLFFRLEVHTDSSACSIAAVEARTTQIPSFRKEKRIRCILQSRHGASDGTYIEAHRGV
jgi:hypothetical protein